MVELEKYRRGWGQEGDRVDARTREVEAGPRWVLWATLGNVVISLWIWKGKH